MEKIKCFKLILLILSLYFFVGCSGNSAKSNITKTNNINPNSKKQIDSGKKEVNTFTKSQQIQTKEIKIENKDGILLIKDKEKEYILSSKGLDYNSHLSSDKMTLVVDVLKMNNLQTIEVFSKKNTNKFKRVKRRIKKDIWNKFFKDKNFEFKDIHNPQLKFYEWVDNDSFEFILSYEFKDKYYEEIIRYDIYIE